MIDDLKKVQLCELDDDDDDDDDENTLVMGDNNLEIDVLGEGA